MSMYHKIIYCISVCFCINAANAQEKYWDPELYYLWDGVFEEFLVGIDESESFIVPGLKGLTDFDSTQMTIGNVGESELTTWTCLFSSYNLSNDGNVLLVDFQRTPENSEEWISFGIDFTNWTSEPPKHSNDKLYLFKRKGYIADLRDSFIIKGEIFIPQDVKIPENETGFSIRASVVDIHGHEWNHGGDPIDTIKPDEFGQWAEFEINYPELQAMYPNANGWFHTLHGDAWSKSFYNVYRPFDDDTTHTIPIDTAHIAGVNFYLMPGQDTAFDVQIQIKNLTLGDGSVRYKNSLPDPVYDKYWVPLEYQEWDAVSQNYLVSVNEANTVRCDGLKGLTNFTESNITVTNSTDDKIGTWHSYAPAYKLAPSGNQLAVFYKREKGDLAEWANFAVDIGRWIGDAPDSTSTDMADYERGGYIADLRKNFVIKGLVYIPENFKASRITNGFTIRASVVDVHGHEWNANGVPADTVESHRFGEWVEFNIDYPWLREVNKNSVWWSDQLGDGYSPNFNNMPRPLEQGRVKYVVPIDTAQISSIRFYFNSGEENAEFSGQIFLKDIVIGDGSVLFKPEQDELKVDSVITHASFEGAYDGAISVTVSGGVKPYIYQWAHGYDGPDIVGLAPGKYRLWVVDAQNSSIEKTFEIRSSKQGPCRIWGHLFDNDDEYIVSGEVILFAVDGGLRPLMKTEINDQAKFVFNNLFPGKYYIYAKSDGYFPAYFYKTQKSADAYEIPLVTEAEHVPVVLEPETEHMVGNNSITGRLRMFDPLFYTSNIFNAGQYATQTEEGEMYAYASGYPVCLYDGTLLIDFTFTDEQGNYSFTELYNDTFTVAVDKPLGLREEVKVAFNDPSPEGASVYFDLYEHKIESYGDIFVSLERGGLESPFHLTEDVLYITANDIGLLEIYSIRGEKLLVSDEKTVDVSSLNPGLYLCRYKTSSKTYVEKVILR